MFETKRRCCGRSGGSQYLIRTMTDRQTAGWPHSEPARLDTNGNNLTLWRSETDRRPVYIGARLPTGQQCQPAATL